MSSFTPALAGDSDDWLDGEDDAMAPAPVSESQKAAKSLFQAGYRDGRTKGHEEGFQENFDDGFAQGMALGRVCGDLWAEIQRAVRNSAALKKGEREELERRAQGALSLLLNDCTSESFSISTVQSRMQELLQIFPAPVLLAQDEWRRAIQQYHDELQRHNERVRHYLDHAEDQNEYVV